MRSAEPARLAHGASPQQMGAALDERIVDQRPDGAQGGRGGDVPRYPVLPEALLHPLEQRDVDVLAVIAEEEEGRQQPAALDRGIEQGITIAELGPMVTESGPYGVADVREQLELPCEPSRLQLVGSRVDGSLEGSGVGDRRGAQRVAQPVRRREHEPVDDVVEVRVAGRLVSHRAGRAASASARSSSSTAY